MGGARERWAHLKLEPLCNCRLLEPALPLGVGALEALLFPQQAAQVLGLERVDAVAHGLAVEMLERRELGRHETRRSDARVRGQEQRELVVQRDANRPRRLAQLRLSRLRSGLYSFTNATRSPVAVREAL